MSKDKLQKNKFFSYNRPKIIREKKRLFFKIPVINKEINLLADIPKEEE